jgi:hypothetical protein
MKTQLKAEMERYFRPELLNRVDDVIVFRSLPLQPCRDDPMSELHVMIEIDHQSARIRPADIEPLLV